MGSILFFAASINAKGILEKPNISDIESTCRTVLYEATNNTNRKDILVLISTYKLLCDDGRIEALKTYTQYMNELSKSNSLSNKVACLSSAGYVHEKLTGSPSFGFYHKEGTLSEIEKVNKAIDIEEDENSVLNAIDLYELKKKELVFKKIDKYGQNKSLNQKTSSGFR